MSEWSCSRCNAAAYTVDDSTPMHRCPATNGLLTPLVIAGTHAKIEVKEREDYVGTEVPQLDSDGRPVMSIVVTRDKGQDCVIFPPAARGTAGHGVLE